MPAEAGPIYAAARRRPRSPPVKYTNGVEAIEFMPPFLSRLQAGSSARRPSGLHSRLKSAMRLFALLKRLRAGGEDSHFRPVRGVRRRRSAPPDLGRPSAPSSLLRRLQRRPPGPR